jgi:hypothetical protein
MRLRGLNRREMPRKGLTLRTTVPGALRVSATRVRVLGARRCGSPGGQPVGTADPEEFNEIHGLGYNVTLTHAS